MHEPRIALWLLIALSAGWVLQPLPAAADPTAPVIHADGAMTGRAQSGERGIVESVASIARRDALFPAGLKPPRRWKQHEIRRAPVANPDAPAVASWPPSAAGAVPRHDLMPRAPQIVSTPNFTAATLADTGAFPPNTMGAVGPTQFIVALNGRIRSFNKTTGAPDGALNVDSDVFFSSVLTVVGGPVSSVFTTNPRIRHDRLSGRWFITMTDVPMTTSGALLPNRLLIAVSNTASITATTNFTFFWFPFSTTNFTADASLGIDANALYIGANMFNSAENFVSSDAAVVQKSSVLGPGPIVFTRFPGLASPTIAGPFSPQGVDNLDPNATAGYVVGVDSLAFGLLAVRRVSNPASATPTLSANLNVGVPSTTSPAPVPHLGNSGGANGRLRALDDRLFAAHLRDGRLWTAHNIRVNADGVAATSTTARNAVRWYELQNLATTPSLRQSGTVFDGAASASAAQEYWIPSVMVSGQGHAALGFSAAGAAFRVDAATVGRLSSDALGTTQGIPVRYTTSPAAYNPPADPGGPAGRLWGEYSYTSLDPCDDQTMWTIQQFTSSANSYGVRAVRLLAPAPTASCAAPTTLTPGGTATVTLTGTGMFDTAAAVGACRLRASAAASGPAVTVTSVTVDSPIQSRVVLSAAASAPLGARALTFSNPDGQSAAPAACVEVVGELVFSDGFE